MRVMRVRSVVSGWWLCVLAVLVVAPVLVAVPHAVGPVGAQSQTQLPPPGGLQHVVVPAGWGLVPAGLGVGDSFRLLFVTEGVGNASSSDVGVYDGFVQESAAGGHPEGAHRAIGAYADLFKVLGSTASVDARTHTGTDPNDPSDGDVPVFWLGGDLVAEGNEGLWSGTWVNNGFYDRRNAAGRVATPASHQAVGPHDTAVESVFTGTNNDGTRSNRPLGDSGLVRVGTWDLGDEKRSPIRQFLNQSNNLSSFYGISPVFVVGSSSSSFGAVYDGPRSVAPVLWTGVAPRRGPVDLYVQQIRVSGASDVDVSLWLAAHEACTRVGFGCTVADAVDPGLGGVAEINADGHPLDADGNLLAANGNPVPAAVGVDYLGRLVDAEGFLLDSNNRRVDGEGRRLDADGFNYDSNNRRVDAAGRRVNADGFNYDSDGNAVVAINNSLIFRVNSDGFFYTADGTVASYSLGFRLNADGSIFINPDDDLHVLLVANVFDTATGFVRGGAPVQGGTPVTGGSPARVATVGGTVEAKVIRVRCLQGTRCATNPPPPEPSQAPVVESDAGSGGAARSGPVLWRPVDPAPRRMSGDLFVQRVFYAPGSFTQIDYDRFLFAHDACAETGFACTSVELVASNPFVDTESTDDAYDRFNAGSYDFDGDGFVIDADGNYVDNAGTAVDSAGRLVNSDGDLIDSHPQMRRVNEDGHFLNADGHRIDSAGSLVDAAGNYVDGDGNFVDEHGNPSTTAMPTTSRWVTDFPRTAGQPVFWRSLDDGGSVIGSVIRVRCATGWRCTFSASGNNADRWQFNTASTGPSQPTVPQRVARPLNERVVSTAEGREIYRIRFDVADEKSRQELQHDAVFDAVCPGTTRGVVFTCETFGHHLNDGIDVDGDGTYELSGTVIGVTLVVTCNPGYSCSRPRITTDPETGVYSAEADWSHQPGRKFYRAVFTPAVGDAAKTTVEMQADAVETAVCSWPDTKVFMCDRFETRDADTNGNDRIDNGDAVSSETFVVSCNTGYRCRGPHLSVTADGVWSAAPTWRDVRDREVYRVSYRAVAVTTPVTPVTTAQKQYEAVVAAAGCDTDGAGASTPGLWCETFPTTDAGSLVTGSTLVVSCVSGFRCVRPRVTVTDGTYTAAVSAEVVVPAAQQPARGRPVAARVSSVRVTRADLNNDGDTTDEYDVLVNGASVYTLAEVDPFSVAGVDEPVCAVTGFSWYGDPRSQFIAPSNSGPRPADWLDDPLNTVANTKRDIWPVGRPADRDRYLNVDGTFGSVLERPIYEYPDAQGKCYAIKLYFLVQQGARWVLRSTPVPYSTSGAGRYNRLEYDVSNVSGTVATITAPYLPKPAEPACLQQWRSAVPFEPNGYLDYCTEAELDAYDRAVEQWSANVDATHGRRGYDPEVNPVINEDGTIDGREPTTPVEGTYPDQRQQLEQREEPYLECISEEEWALLVGWWGPRCHIVYPT